MKTKEQQLADDIDNCIERAGQECLYPVSEPYKTNEWIRIRLLEQFDIKKKELDREKMQ